ncbi:MAG: hydrogenase maturation nickel metallochaperone HypA [Gammaproteobacteria bacterium]|nr:hydrogenase maturation nickel metallochaperone HypA [Gammaproteobacteria bacterium]
MHEMSLAASVLELVENSAKVNGFSRVKTVWLEIGALAGVEAEAMRFCFEAVVKGTLAEGARLEIVATKGQGKCLDCGGSVFIEARYDPCSLCGGYRVEPAGGMAMRVKELEVE